MILHISQGILVSLPVITSLVTENTSTTIDPYQYYQSAVKYWRDLRILTWTVTLNSTLYCVVNSQGAAQSAPLLLPWSICMTSYYRTWMTAHWLVRYSSTCTRPLTWWIIPSCYRSWEAMVLEAESICGLPHILSTAIAYWNVVFFRPSSTQYDIVL